MGSQLSPKRSTAPTFWSMSIMAKWLDGSRCHLVRTGWAKKRGHLDFYSSPHCMRCTSYSNSVRPSVCLSVTRRYCVKTTARSTVQFAPLDSKLKLAARAVLSADAGLLVLPFYIELICIIVHATIERWRIKYSLWSSLMIICSSLLLAASGWWLHHICIYVFSSVFAYFWHGICWILLRN